MARGPHGGYREQPCDEISEQHFDDDLIPGLTFNCKQNFTLEGGLPGPVHSVLGTTIRGREDKGCWCIQYHNKKNKCSL